jgi:hypothetical protein
MDIEISKVSYEKISLSDEQVMQITIKYLKKLLQPGEWISPNNRLMMEDDHRHGSPIDRDVGEATEIQLAAWTMLNRLRDLEKEKRMCEDIEKRCRQKG